jgi:drug/metabolite transporter (DMT)-like permease
MATVSWLIYAIIVPVLWGSGYTFLVPVSKQLTSYTISTLYGASLAIVNFLVGVFVNNVENYFVLADPKVSGCFLGYLIMLVSANFLYLSGYKIASQDGSAGAFVAVTSTYPLFTYIFSTIIFKQSSNYYYTIPAMMLIATGIILLSVAPKPPT